VKGFPKARYKKFPTKEEATKFMSSEAQGPAIGDMQRAKPVELNEDLRRTSFIIDMYDKTTVSTSFYIWSFAF
jgi:viroplasmin and RNaseH domain-containing protein